MSILAGSQRSSGFAASSNESPDRNKLLEGILKPLEQPIIHTQLSEDRQVDVHVEDQRNDSQLSF